MLCEEILNNLSEIIENRNNNIIYTIFSFTKNVIQNKEIVMEEQPNINNEINQKMSNSIFGIFFRKDKTGFLSLSFGQKYLDTYNKHSTPHYVMLIHELKHIYDYYSNKDDFFNSSPKERFYYEIEAKKIEYEFIKNYLVGQYQLTKLEDYIMKSYENDGLEAYNIINHKDSSTMFQFLIDLEAEYKINKITKQQIIDKIILKIDSLLEKSNTFLTPFSVYQQNDNHFRNYVNFMRLKTFIKYYDVIIVPILNYITTPELQERIETIYRLIQIHNQPNHLYSLSLENYFEDAINSKEQAFLKCENIT
jgi:hypothetical protein